MDDATPDLSGKGAARPGPAAVGALAFMGAVLAAIGAVLGVQQVGALRLARDVPGFQMVPAEVLEVATRPADTRFAQHEPRVCYSYLAGEAQARYESDVYSATPPRFDSRREAEAHAAEAGYQVGRRVVAYVDPADPLRVVLTSQVDGGQVALRWVLVVLSCAIVALGVFMGLAAAFSKRFRRGLGAPGPSPAAAAS